MLVALTNVTMQTIERMKAFYEPMLWTSAEYETLQKALKCT